jgi:thioester reductase-like protein
LRDANVGSTREILRFACHGVAKRFHHVSTAFVFDTKPLAGQQVDEATALIAPDQISVGYSQSKWVAEQLAQALRIPRPLSFRKSAMVL